VSKKRFKKVYKPWGRLVPDTVDRLMSAGALRLVIERKIEERAPTHWPFGPKRKVPYWQITAEFEGDEAS
jgi:hypothetical protein